MLAQLTDTEAGLSIACLCLGVLGLAGRLAVVARRLRKASHQLSVLDRFIQTAPTPVMIFDQDSLGLITANIEALKFIGNSGVTEVFTMGQMMKDQDLQTLLKRLRTTRISTPTRTLLHFPSRPEFWALLSATRVQDGEKNLVRLVFIDIDEPIRLNEQIAMAKLRFESLIKASPDGIVVLEVDGMVRFVSDSCLQFKNGAHPLPQIGESLYDSVPPQLVMEIKSYIARLVLHEDTSDLVQEAILLDGSSLWIEVRGAVVKDPFSERNVVMLAIRDVSRRMRSEKDLKMHVRELEEANARITKLQQEVLNICAWTKQVNVDGKWIPVDTYLSQHLGLVLTHGISDDGLAIFEKESGITLPRDEHSPGGEAKP